MVKDKEQTTLIPDFLFSHLLVENPFKNPVEAGLVGEESVEFFEVAGIVAEGEPHAQVAVGAVFLVEVLDGAPTVAFAVKVGVVRKAILDGAPDYGLGVDVAVGLGDYQAVFATGTVAA